MVNNLPVITETLTSNWWKQMQDTHPSTRPISGSSFKELEEGLYEKGGGQDHNWEIYGDS